MLDTRTSNVPPSWSPATPVGPDGTVELPVAGQHGAPIDATAVVVNLTGVGPTSATAVTAFPGLLPMPTASNLNLTPGSITPNLVVDVVGAYGPTGADLFVPTAPTRLLDTRTPNVPSSWLAGTPVGADGVRRPST